MVYPIYEGNMDRLRKKLVRIQNKCRKYGGDFRFEEVGEEFREIKEEDGRVVTRRFVLVEAEGIAVVNGWKFVASIDHTDKGNVINKVVEVEVPERYYNSEPFCEHCKTKRFRANTYLVMNEETGEFKQVGKSCLKDFTGGMDAELITKYMSFFDDLVEGEVPIGGGYAERYIEKEEWLRYVAETVRHFGYVKADDLRSTRERAGDYYGVEHGWFSGPYGEKVRRELAEEMSSVGFDAENEKACDMVVEALTWLDGQKEGNNYMHNLKTVCALKYLPMKHLGIAASLFPTWNKDLERAEERRKAEEKAKASEWVGEVGKRVTVEVAEAKVVTGWETQWGYVSIYKITDAAGNVYTWKTSGYIPEDVAEIVGTVKDHNEYRGCKQTELTRCKCVRRPREVENRAVEGRNQFEEAYDMLLKGDWA